MKPARVVVLVCAVSLWLLWGFGGEPVRAGPEPQLPGNAARYDVAIVKSYPHDPDAFTQGLVFADGVLYESTGLYGKSSLRQVDLETGAVLKIQPLAGDLFGEGLALREKQLIQLTWRSGIALVYDQTSLRREGEFHYRGEGWGLAHDGRALIMSDGSALLRFIDPDTFSEQRRVEVIDNGVPVRNLNALAYVKNEIWANIWQQDVIAMISPASGRVRAWIDLAKLRRALGPARNAEVLNGIACDAARDRVFVTGKYWPKLFEITLVPVKGDK